MTHRLGFPLSLVSITFRHGPRPELNLFTTSLRLLVAAKMTENTEGGLYPIAVLM